MIYGRYLFAIVLFSLLVFFGRVEADAGNQIVLVGDSTVADWAKEKPARGWGQLLSEFLNGEVGVLNLAVCGASTKTFPATGNWQRALSSGGKFLLIQFGHNDAHGPGKPESTVADGDYADNLKRFIDEARAAGLTPILVTPVHRRMFGADGLPSKELEPYAAAMRRVASEAGVPLIDLYESSGKYFEGLGEQGSVGITVSDVDRSHFTETGARAIAGQVAEGMRGCSPELGALLKPEVAP